MPEPRNTDTRKHTRAHNFTALYEHFGPYGDQDAHFHACFEEGCDALLVGKGRTCDSERKSHRVRAGVSVSGDSGAQG